MRFPQKGKEPLGDSKMSTRSFSESRGFL